MSETINIKSWLARKTVVLLDFLHGGLTMSGILFCLALATLVAGNPAAHHALKSLQAKFSHVQTGTVLDDASAFGTSPVSDELREATLTPEMRAALEFVSRKYRVSASALDPVFIAAQTAGQEMKIDPLLIVAVIAIESRFNPFAESVVGAQGLMQVMPRYHQDKIPEGEGKLALFDPEINVQVGTQILRDSIKRMGGLTPGLQQFAGAIDDPDQSYSNKILAEKQLIENAARRGRVS